MKLTYLKYNVNYNHYKITSMTLRKVIFFCRRSLNSALRATAAAFVVFYFLNRNLGLELKRNRIDIEDPFVINYMNLRGNMSELKSYLNAWISYNASLVIQKGISANANEKLKTQYTVLANSIKNNLEVGMQWNKLNKLLLSKKVYQRLTDLCCNYKNIRLTSSNLKQISTDLSENGLDVVVKESAGNLSANSTGLDEKKYQDLLYKISVPKVLAGDLLSSDELKFKYFEFNKQLTDIIKEHLTSLNTSISEDSLTQISQYISCVIFQALNDSISRIILKQIDLVSFGSTSTYFSFIDRRFEISRELQRTIPLYLNFTKLLFDSITKAENLGLVLAQIKTTKMPRANFAYAYGDQGDSLVKRQIIYAILYSTRHQDLTVETIYTQDFRSNLNKLILSCDKIVPVLAANFRNKLFIFIFLSLFFTSVAANVLYNLKDVREIYIRYFTYLVEYDDWMFTVYFCQVIYLTFIMALLAFFAYYLMFATHFGTEFYNNKYNALFSSALQRKIIDRIKYLFFYYLLSFAFSTWVFYRSQIYSLNENMRYINYTLTGVKIIYEFVALLTIINAPLTKKLYGTSILFQQIENLASGISSVEPVDTNYTISKFIYNINELGSVSYFRPERLNKFNKSAIVIAFDIFYYLIVALTFIAPLTIKIKNIPYLGVSEFVAL